MELLLIRTLVMELQLPLFSLTASLLALFVVIIISRRSNKLKEEGKKKSSLPPGPWKLPLVGSIHRMVGALPHHALRKLSNEYGPVMHLKLGATELVVISSPAAAKEIMSTNDINFASRPYFHILSLGGYGPLSILMSPYGEYWRQLKKISLLELLSAKRVKSFSSIREEAVSNLVEHISSRNGSPVNLTQMFLELTYTIVSQAACGEKCRHQESLISALLDLAKIVIGFSIGELFPSVKYLDVFTGKKSRFDRSLRQLDAILDEIIREHQTETREQEKEDLLDVLLRIKEDGDLEVPLTMESIKAVVAEMFGAGTETSARAMEWAMAELVRKPEMMAKAQAEARSVLGGKDAISECNVGKLNYLSMIIKETLRLHPPVPLLIPRVCAETCEVGGYVIPAGMRVVVNSWALGRHPDHWEDAESFRPERFEESGLDFKGTDLKFVPFGAGRRICPGTMFGLGAVELALANLLSRFDWELPEGKGPEDLDMTEAFGVTAGRKSELLLIARPYVAP